MKMKYYIIIAFIISPGSFLLADGLLMPVNEGYPKDFLRNRMTHVDVTIHGMVAETQVYQEFVNEWSDSTDAVYSFPLPAEARATEFIYWYDDQAYKAILKIREQSTNPGTGEGGIAAVVNKYIGRNGIKIRLKGIKAGMIQKVRLHYISRCEYFQGKHVYKFPLNTEDFVKHPLDHLQFSIKVHSNSRIITHDIATHPNYRVVSQSDSLLNIEMSQPKAYVNQNFEFSYSVENNVLSTDFYSIKNDTTDGHFALFVRPQNQAEADSVLPKRILFLLSRSNSMSGYKLSQSIASIKQILDFLHADDLFNIVLYTNSITNWNTAPVLASTENISTAKTYLESISTSWGSRMDLGIKACLSQIKNEDFSNAILAFTDGKSPLDPREIDTLNTYKTGIFPIGFGDNLNRARLEMMAGLNYGFVTYIDDDENISVEIDKVFKRVSQPLLKDVSLEYGRADLTQLIPSKPPSTYAGSYFFMAGRYTNPGSSALSIAGESAGGLHVYDFLLDFAVGSKQNKFVEYLWAKEMIDALEWEIEIYGETEALKEELIALSLKYNIRCRYTAYIADYETEYDFTRIDIDDESKLPISFIAGNYPNPFNPVTNIRIFISQDVLGKTKLVKIYNILGQLVAVIDISHLGSGWHNINFNAIDQFGNKLPSGVYIVQLQIGNRHFGSKRINLVK